MSLYSQYEMYQTFPNDPIHFCGVYQEQLDIMRQFPDLPLFISHDQFPAFLRLWFDSQKNTKEQGLLDEIEQQIRMLNDSEHDSPISCAFRQLKYTLTPKVLYNQEFVESTSTDFAAFYIPNDDSCFWGSSAPVTPSVEQTQYQQFLSLPTTPTWVNDSYIPLDLSEDDESEREKDDLADADYEVCPKRKKPARKHQTRREPRRTATSYDKKTTQYLKSVFFDIYSVRDKLTKEQRRQVQKETGLKPRNITYWFSNHKRRFQSSLAVFRKTVNASNGQVKTYNDFLKWRADHGLPQEVSENEYKS